MENNSKNTQICRIIYTLLKKNSLFSRGLDQLFGTHQNSFTTEFCTFRSQNLGEKIFFLVFTTGGGNYFTYSGNNAIKFLWQPKCGAQLKLYKGRNFVLLNYCNPQVLDPTNNQLSLKSQDLWIKNEVGIL